MKEQEVVISKNVKFGEGVIIEGGVKIGVLSPGKPDDKETVIGNNCYFRTNTVVYAGVEIGNDFETGHNVVIREDNKIGDGVVVWSNSVINPGNIIGDRTRIHAGCFLEFTRVGKGVFIAPGVIFASDPHPTIDAPRTCRQGATVDDSAVIGANVTILPHVLIGRKAVIGAGAVVVKDVPENKVAVGNPASVIKDSTDIYCNRDMSHYPYREDE